MIRRIVATFIYVEETVNAQKLPIKNEYRKEVKGGLGDVYSNKYYSALNRDIELIATLKVREEHVKDFQGGELRYVLIDNKKCSIDKYTKISGRYFLLDLKEEK